MRKILLVAIAILIFTLSGAQTIQNRYAKGFTIEKTNSGYIVKILNPYSKDNPVFEQYTLIKDEKYRKNRSDIKIPIKRMALLSSPFVGMAEALECIDNISAIDNPTYITTDLYTTNLSLGLLKQLGRVMIFVLRHC